MTNNEYHFITHWRVESTVDEVSKILGDPLALMKWWPSVYLDVKVVEPGEESGLGRVASLYTKGWLPYCNGYLGYPFDKKAIWTGIARLFLSVRWNIAIDPEGGSFSFIKENTGVGATNHQGMHAQAAGEACHGHL